MSVLEKEEFVEKLRQAGMRPIANGDTILIFPGKEHLVKCPTCGRYTNNMRVPTNRDWLSSLSTVELVCWIKNTASAMSDAELLKWMEEKHETD